MDMHGNRLDQLNIELQRAVSEERYSDAARLQGEAAALVAGDAVAGLQRRMGEALEAEDYAQAAALRDEGYAWLEGWWWGKAQDDSVGHLMRVTAEYGRWTGKVYSARDLAEAMGWYNGAVGGAGAGGDALRWRGGRGGGGAPAPPAPRGGADSVNAAVLEDLGAPLLEVFLRDDPSQLRSQPVCLWPGGGLGAGDALGRGGGLGGARALLSVLGATGGRMRGMGSALLEDVVDSSLLLAEEDDEIMRAVSDLGAFDGDEEDAAATAVLTVSVDEDGVATITADQVAEYGQAAAESVFGVEEEQQQQQQEGVLDGDGSLRLSSFRSQWEQEEVEATMRELRAGSAGGERAPPVLPGGGGAFMRPLFGRQEPGEEQQHQQQHDQGHEQERRHRREAAAYGGRPQAPQPPRAPAGDAWDLQRFPADICPIGRDRFVLLPREVPSAPQQQLEQQQQQHRASTPDAALEAPRPPSPTPDDPRNGAASVAAFGGSASDDGCGGAGEDEMWGQVAEEVARIQEERSGVRVPRRELAEAIRTVARRLVREGRLPSDAATKVRVVSSAGAAPAAAAQPPPLLPAQDEPLTAGAVARARAAAAPAAPSVTYSRIHASALGPSTDPLSGLYIGSFGAHGPELLQLTRGLDEDGDECVLGYKVTGDENVPCGQVSFRAKVGRRHRLDPRSHYPEDMGVSARYAGEGRIADSDFSNAKWVDGELLLFSPSANPLVTGGARVGFVWSVPNDRRFLILLNRIQLE